MDPLCIIFDCYEVAIYWIDGIPFCVKHGPAIEDEPTPAASASADDLYVGICPDCGGDSGNGDNRCYQCQEAYLFA